MEMRDKILLSAAIAASAAFPAHAQSINPASGPSFAGTVSGSLVSSSTLGASTVTPTGNETVSPYVRTLTTVQSVTLSSSSAGSTGGTVSFSGNTYGYTISGSGAATTPAQITYTVVEQYVTTSTGVAFSSSTSTSSGPTATGTQTVSALSVSGSAGSASSTGAVLYGGNLSSSGTLNSNGTVNVTENTVGISTSGTTYSSYSGTASYNAGTGAITVGPLALVSAASLGSAGLAVTNGTATSTYGATGLSTGTVAATTVNATNVNAAAVTVTGSSTSNGLTVGTPKLATDAANKGYVDTAIAGVNTSVNNLAALVEANRKRSDAGIATAVALSGGSFLPGKKINVTANIGAFRDEVAIAGQIGILVNENVALNAGVATSFHSYGGTSLRGGVTFGF